MTLLLLTILILKFRKWKAKRQLKRQQMLSSRGIGFRTTVLEITEGKTSFDGYRRFCIRTLLRVKGKVVCRRVYTFLNEQMVLHVGDKVLIRYNPYHPGQVLLCNRTQS